MANKLKPSVAYAASFGAETTVAVRAALRRLCENPIHLHRGFHTCQFCPADVRDEQEPAMGNGQVRIQGPDGTWFAAPAMIHHYVVAHDDRPPPEFVHAVLHPAAIVLDDE